MRPRLAPRLVSLALLLAGCGPGTPSRPGAASPDAWFDDPVPGTVVRARANCEILAHGTSSIGLKGVELWINGMQDTALVSAAESEALMTYSRDCSDFAPGKYVLRLRVQDANSEWSRDAQTNLTVTDGPRLTPSPPPETVATPTRTPPSRGGTVSIESLSSNAVHSGDETCGPVEVTITARASAPKGITVVVLFYRVEPGSPLGYESVVMTSIGRGLYERTVSPNSVLDGAAEGVLEYQVVVQQADGDTSLRTPVLTDIAVEPCGAVSAPGTAPAGCFRYTSKRACESHGCNWVLLPAIFPVFACGNP